MIPELAIMITLLVGGTKIVLLQGAKEELSEKIVLLQKQQSGVKIIIKSKPKITVTNVNNNNTPPPEPKR